MNVKGYCDGKFVVSFGVLDVRLRAGFSAGRMPIITYAWVGYKLTPFYQSLN